MYHGPWHEVPTIPTLECTAADRQGRVRYIIYFSCTLYLYTADTAVVVGSMTNTRTLTHYKYYDTSNSILCTAVLRIYYIWYSSSVFHTTDCTGRRMCKLLPLLYTKYSVVHRVGWEYANTYPTNIAAAQSSTRPFVHKIRSTTT